jgi:hypothetical protein
MWGFLIVPRRLLRPANDGSHQPNGPGREFHSGPNVVRSRSHRLQRAGRAAPGWYRRYRRHGRDQLSGLLDGEPLDAANLELHVVHPDGPCLVHSDWHLELRDLGEQHADE